MNGSGEFGVKYDGEWANIALSHFQILLQPGPYSIWVSGKGVVAGFDADVGVRVDNVVPLPAALPLFAAGLGAIALMGWRRKRTAAIST